MIFASILRPMNVGGGARANPVENSEMLRFKLLNAPRPGGWSHLGIDFDPDVPFAKADGVLSWGGVPNTEFLSFRGIRAWYISEPINERCFKTKNAKHALKSLSASEFLHHSSTDARYHVPAVTHYGPRQALYRNDRPIELGATVNNFGNRGWRLMRAHRLRNAFVTDPRVSLFGSKESWLNFRSWPWARAGSPSNYIGHPNAGDWHQSSFCQFLTQFKIYVCLENSITPFWFTEKMVNAARAGCVPIYHAHPTVRERFLKGAFWIDPKDYNFNIDRTIRAALECDHEAVRSQNYSWLKSSQLDPTEGFAIWTQIAEILLERHRLERG